MIRQEVVVMVIGIGRIGRIHAGNLARMQKVKVRYIVDIDMDAVTQYIREFGLSATQPLHFDDISRAYNDVEVNSAIICTPTTSHEQHVINALNAGKNVMCEKPLAFSLESISRCYEIAREKDLHLYCAFNRRFDPQIRSAWMDKEKIAGNLKSIKVTSRDMPRNSIEYLKISGGMSIDQCIHDVDLIRWFAQENPTTVYSLGHAFFDDIRKIGDVDQLYVTMQFGDGTMGHVDANREAVYGYDHRCEIFGDKGMIVCENKRELSTQQYTEAGNIAPAVIKDNMKRFEDSYWEEMVHFVNVIRRKEKIAVKSRDTLWATLICEASRQSLVTKQPIRMDEFAAKVFPKLLDMLP